MMYRENNILCDNAQFLLTPTQTALPGRVIYARQRENQPVLVKAGIIRRTRHAASRSTTPVDSTQDADITSWKPHYGDVPPSVKNSIARTSQILAETLVKVYMRNSKVRPLFCASIYLSIQVSIYIYFSLQLFLIQANSDDFITQLITMHSLCRMQFKS